MPKTYNYPRISDEEYEHALGQLQLQLNGVFSPFRCYGLDVYIEGAKTEVIHLAEAFAMRVRGKPEVIQMKGSIVPTPFT